jgi:phosphonatase-like hydrolase
MPYKLAVFDIAGTTLYDEQAVAQSFQKAFQKKNIAVEITDAVPLMGYKKTQAIVLLLEKKGIVFDNEMVNDIHDNFIDEMLDYYEYDPEVRPFPDAEEVFIEIKEKGTRITLNTGFPKVIASAIMKRTQWIEKGLVDDYIASDEVKKGRPHPFMINELMRRFGIDNPADVIKIGDTEADINEGRNSNCGLVVAVTTGAFTREQLEPYRPDYIVDSLSDLPKLIG